MYSMAHLIEAETVETALESLDIKKHELTQCLLTACKWQDVEGMEKFLEKIIIVNKTKQYIENIFLLEL